MALKAVFQKLPHICLSGKNSKSTDLLIMFAKIGLITDAEIFTRDKAHLNVCNGSIILHISFEL